MREIIVIQCQGRKTQESWRCGNQQVIFVADKKKYDEKSNRASGLVPYEPDDFVSNSSTMTWRQIFLEYYQTKRKPAVLQDANELPEAWQLYRHSAYRCLVENKKYGKENVFILSAGWGLVNADYWLPPYNITFSTAENTPDYARTSVKKLWQRLEPLKYNPLCKIANKDTTIYFFGGKDYIPLYYHLTCNLPCRKVVYYKSAKIPRHKGYEYVPYAGDIVTNWHYQCLKDFMEGKLRK